MTTTDPKANPNTLIVLDGISGITNQQAKAFLDGKRALLDGNSSAFDYLELSFEYDSIGAMTEAAAMWQKYEELNNGK